jgi:predicted phage tail protein
MMTTLHLGGFLGERYGRKHRLEVDRIQDVVRGLACQIPGFRKDVLDYRPGFHLIVGDRDLGPGQLGMRPAHEDVYLVPAIMGGGGNTPWLQIIIGAALIYFTAGAASPAVAAATGTSMSAAAGMGLSAGMIGAISSVGYAMVLGGISQMLYQPATAAAPGERPENQPSYVFNGAVNAEAQGHPIPLLYGQLRVGSIVVSAGIETVQMTSVSGGGGGGGGGVGDWDNWNDDGGGGWITTNQVVV